MFPDNSERDILPNSSSHDGGGSGGHGRRARRHDVRVGRRPGGVGVGTEPREFSVVARHGHGQCVGSNHCGAYVSPPFNDVVFTGQRVSVKGSAASRGACSGIVG